MNTKESQAITNLPFEILIKIFSYLNKHEKLSLRLVSKTFKKAAENKNLWPGIAAKEDRTIKLSSLINEALYKSLISESLTEEGYLDLALKVEAAKNMNLVDGLGADQSALMLHAARSRVKIFNQHLTSVNENDYMRVLFPTSFLLTATATGIWSLFYFLDPADFTSATESFVCSVNAEFYDNCQDLISNYLKCTLVEWFLIGSSSGFLLKTMDCIIDWNLQVSVYPRAVLPKLDEENSPSYRNKWFYRLWKLYECRDNICLTTAIVLSLILWWQEPLNYDVLQCASLMFDQDGSFLEMDTDCLNEDVSKLTRNIISLAIPDGIMTAFSFFSTLNLQVKCVRKAANLVKSAYNKIGFFRKAEQDSNSEVAPLLQPAIYSA